MQIQQLLSERRQLKVIDYQREAGTPAFPTYYHKTNRYENNENEFNLGNGFVDPLYA